jgi:putative tryptophan/tyrosine transport system substrate-binding protein
MKGDPMQRRDFITLLGGSAAAWPLAARAQQDGRVRRVGVLVNGPENDPENQVLFAAFRQGVERLGWLEGRNLRLDRRFAANTDQFQPLAKELIALQPEVIFAHTTLVVAAVRRESGTIPIVFTSVSDPIGSGFITSLARPGGNATGFLLYEDGIAGKWLAMLKEIAPHLMRAAIIANPKNTPFDYFLRSAEAAAPGLAIELVPSRIETAADIERAIESFARVPNGGLVFLPDVTSLTNRDLIIALAARYRLPAVYNQRVFVTAGGLMSYSTERVDQFRQAATYVDRILRGDKPADLPVQAPVKYETILNLKAAKALGLTVPDLLLVRADEVIE